MGLSRARQFRSSIVRTLAALVVVAIGGAAQAQVAGAPKSKPKPTVAVPTTPGTSCTTAECHQPIVNHTVRHNPAGTDCSACHVQVGEVAAHKFSLVATAEQLCLKCHQLPTQKHNHAPVVEGKCMECHDPHGSEHKFVLKGDPNRDLCVSCHNAEFMKKAFVHGPVAVGACSTCHKAHSSDTPKLLAASRARRR